MCWSIFPRYDRDPAKILEEFGGWERVLDPAFQLPGRSYAVFERAGYSRQRLDKMRTEEGRPEREAWIERISDMSYQRWRASASGNAIHYRNVRIGDDLGKQVEVVSGSIGTETVVINPNDSLREGTRVTVEKQ